MTGRKLSFVWVLAAGVVLGVAGLSGTPAALQAANGAPAAQGAGPGRGGSSQGPGGGYWEWWNDAEVQKELGLTADKVKSINDFYTRRNDDLRPIVHEFLKQREELEKMTRARVVDESTYLLQVMRVEHARARLNESRTVMLYRMFRSLTPEQHQKLQGLMDRGAGRGGRGRATPAR